MPLWLARRECAHALVEVGPARVAHGAVRRGRRRVGGDWRRPAVAAALGRGRRRLVGMVHLELLGPVLAELRQTALRSGRHAPRNDHGVAPAVTGAARWAGRRLVDAGEQTGLWRVGTGNLLTARGTGSRSASMARLRIRRGRGPRARTRPSAARAHRRPQTGASKGQKGGRANTDFRCSTKSGVSRDRSSPCSAGVGVPVASPAAAPRQTRPEALREHFD